MKNIILRFIKHILIGFIVFSFFYIITLVFFKNESELLLSIALFSYLIYLLFNIFSKYFK